MSNTKISALTAGSPAQSTDAIPAARSGANVKLLVSDLSAAATNGLTITSSTGTLAIANGKTATLSNTLTLAGTDGTTMTFPSTSATLARTDAANTFTGSQKGTFDSLSSNIASTGVLSLANTDTIAWRNAANSTDLPLGVSSTNQLTFNSSVVASEVFRSLNTGLTANFNSGSAKTLFTPTTAGAWRISYSQQITTAATTSCTFPSLTLGYTDVGGIARTLTLVVSSSTNSTTNITQGSTVIYTNGSTAVTVTSASYATSGATSMQYALAVTAESL